MTLGRLILLYLSKKWPKNQSPDKRGAGKWWFSQCTVSPAAFWKCVFWDTLLVFVFLLFTLSLAKKIKIQSTNSSTLKVCPLLGWSRPTTPSPCFLLICWIRPRWVLWVAYCPAVFFLYLTLAFVMKHSWVGQLTSKWVISNSIAWIFSITRVIICRWYMWGAMSRTSVYRPSTMKDQTLTSQSIFDHIFH